MKRRKFDWRTPEQKQALAQHQDHLDQQAEISAAEIRYNAMVDTIVEIASVLASVRPAEASDRPWRYDGHPGGQAMTRRGHLRLVPNCPHTELDVIRNGMRNMLACSQCGEVIARDLAMYIKQ